MFANSLTLCLMSLVVLPVAMARTYYVAPDGNDNASGSLSQPFATLQRAHDEVSAGDTVFIRGGTYYTQTPAENDAGIILYKNGRSDTERIYYWAYPGETPVFDFSNLQISTSSYTHGIVVTGSWLHFKGLEITNVPMNINSNAGMYVRESGDNIFELMNFHHNSGTGVFVNGSRGRGGHLFLNCDSHDNYDPTGRQGDGQNADGFGVHYQTTGKVTVFRGCRAWWNSDDGWDFISQEVPVVVENSMAMGNGWANYGTTRPRDGNGNGFKAGSSKTGIRHIIRQCVAWKNRASGFYANHSSGGNDWFNNTSYENGTQYNMLASTWDADGNRTDGVLLTGDKVHVMRNNIGYPWDNTNMQGVDSRNNTWDLNITPNANDFLSVDDPSMSITGRDLSQDTGMLGPRNADGSLPVTDFLKLSEGSQMIDQGVDVGLPTMNLPDLGAYELGLDSGFVFVPADSFSYEAENTKLNQAVVESEHTGFSGFGYANFDNVTGSAIEFSVVVSQAGEQEVALRYSNGSTNFRPVSVAVNGNLVLSSLEFPPTADWDSWSSVTTNIQLQEGVNTILLTSIQEDGGPNVDKLEITQDVPVGIASGKISFSYDPLQHKLFVPKGSLSLRLYSARGEIVYELSSNELSVSGGEYGIPFQTLESGVYFLRVQSLHSGEVLWSRMVRNFR